MLTLAIGLALDSPKPILLETYYAPFVHRSELRIIDSELNALVGTHNSSDPAKFAIQTGLREFLLRREQAGDKRRANQQPMYLLLDDAIGVRYALALMQVLEPRIDSKGFEEAPGVRNILEDSPRVPAVARTLVRQHARERAYSTQGRY